MIQIVILISFVYVLYHYGLMTAMIFFGGSVFGFAILYTILELMAHPEKYMKK